MKRYAKQMALQEAQDIICLLSAFCVAGWLAPVGCKFQKGSWYSGLYLLQLDSKPGLKRTDSQPMFIMDDNNKWLEGNTQGDMTEDWGGGDGKVALLREISLKGVI